MRSATHVVVQYPELWRGDASKQYVQLENSSAEFRRIAELVIALSYFLEEDATARLARMGIVINKDMYVAVRAAPRDE